MKITALGAGGFAGTTQYHEVDTAANPAGPALEAALAANHFFDAAPPAAAHAVGADLQRWTIAVDADGHRHSISFVQDGSAASRPWAALLARILAA